MKVNKMSRYINVDAYKKLIEKEMADCYPTEDEFEDGCKTGLEIAVEVLDEMPSADVRENIHGEWIDYDDDYGSLMCSICDKDAPDDIPWDFCPFCGADMRGKTE